MKKLINKKTGEIAYIDLYFNTITFSKSKTTHKISIQKDPNTHQITKITTFPEPIINPISEPISEPAPEPIINNTSSEPSNTSTPNTIISSSESTNTPTSNINNNTSQNSNPHHSNSKTKKNNNNTQSKIIEPEFMDQYSIYEMFPETEFFDLPNPYNDMDSLSTYRIPA